MLGAVDLGIADHRNCASSAKAARAADAALARAERRPLLGIPMTVKESFNVAGPPTTFGNPKFKDFIPKEDALIVSRIKSASAVVLGTIPPTPRQPRKLIAVAA
jgi:amidase